MHDDDGDMEKEFVLFSFIWDEWARMDIIGHWLNVRQGSCQAMGVSGILVVELKKEEQEGK
jgi:hypothetical protein